MILHICFVSYVKSWKRLKNTSKIIKTNNPYLTLWCMAMKVSHYTHARWKSRFQTKSYFWHNTRKKTSASLEWIVIQQRIVVWNKQNKINISKSWKHQTDNHFFNHRQCWGIDRISTLQWQPFFSHRQCWGFDHISTLIQHRNVDRYSKLKLWCCINIEIWLHNVMTNIQPYFNVDTTLCACWDETEGYVDYGIYGVKSIWNGTIVIKDH